MSVQDSQSQSQNNQENEALKAHVAKVEKLSEELLRLYDIEEAAELNIRENFEHAEQDSQNLEQYEDELKRAIDIIENFDISKDNNFLFMLKLDERLQNITLHHVGDKDVRPQYLFIEEARNYYDKNELQKSKQLADYALLTLQTLYQINGNLLEILNIYDRKTLNQPSTQEHEKVENQEARTRQTIQKLQQEKKRTESMHKKLLNRRKFN